MDREFRTVFVMGFLLAASQLVALLIAPYFVVNQMSAFPNPNDVANTVIYIVLIFVFTGIILFLVKYGRKNLARWIVLASVYITIAFVLILPVEYFLIWLPWITFDATSFAILTFVLPFALAFGLTWLLVKYPEWYVVDAIGLLTAGGVTAILGISFGWFPAFLLLVALAFYDAWAVYHTKHMVTLADELTSQRLPVLLVIPKHAGYKFSQQPSLKEQVGQGEEREAMFIGLGDLIIPGTMSVSAWFSFQGFAGNALPGLSPNMTLAVGTLIGSLAGFLILMRFVLKGNPQAGLPLLNGGALAGFFITNFLVFGTIVPAIPKFF